MQDVQFGADRSAETCTQEYQLDDDLFGNECIAIVTTGPVKKLTESLSSETDQSLYVQFGADRSAETCTQEYQLDDDLFENECIAIVTTGPVKKLTESLSSETDQSLYVQFGADRSAETCTQEYQLDDDLFENECIAIVTTGPVKKLTESLSSETDQSLYVQFGADRSAETCTQEYQLDDDLFENECIANVTTGPVKKLTESSSSEADQSLSKSSFGICEDCDEDKSRPSELVTGENETLPSEIEALPIGNEAPPLSLEDDGDFVLGTGSSLGSSLERLIQPSSISLYHLNPFTLAAQLAVLGRGDDEAKNVTDDGVEEVCSSQPHSRRQKSGPDDDEGRHVTHRNLFQSLVSPSMYVQLSFQVHTLMTQMLSVYLKLNNFPVWTMAIRSCQDSIVVVG